MPPVAAVTPPAPPTPSSLPSLAELRALELRFDGPIPPQALADLRTEMKAMENEQRRRAQAARALQPYARTLAAVTQALGS